MTRPHGALACAELALALLITALIVSLNLRFATQAGPLWRDEVSTVQLATRSTYTEVLRSLSLDSAPALYPTLLRLWSSPWSDGGQDVALRVLGFGVATAMLGAIWVTGRTLASGPPLLALAVFAAHAGMLQTAGSVKPYGLGGLFIVLAFGAIGRLTAAPRRRALLYALTVAILAVQTLYHNAPLILAVCVAGFAVAAVARERSAALAVLATGVVAAVSLLPYVGVLLASRSWRPLNQSELGARALLVRSSEMVTEGSWPLAALWAAAAVLVVYGVVRALRRSLSADPASRTHVLYAVLVIVAATSLHLGFLKLAGRVPQAWQFVPLIAVVALANDVGRAPGAPVRCDPRRAGVPAPGLAGGRPSLPARRLRPARPPSRTRPPDGMERRTLHDRVGAADRPLRADPCRASGRRQNSRRSSRERPREHGIASGRRLAAARTPERGLEDSRASLLTQVGPADLRVVGQLGRGSRERDRAGLEDVAPVRDRQRHRRVLLHEQDRRPLPVDVGDRVEDLLDEDRGEPHARLVQQEEPRVRHQGAADREHLLLAPRQGACDLRDPLLEPREECEDALEVGRDPRVAPRIGAHHEVLADREAIEDPPSLRDVGDTPPHDLVGRHADERFGLQRNRAAQGVEEPRDGLERRRLSGAVVPEDRDDLTAAHLESHPLERPDLAVGHVERVDPKHGVPSGDPSRACRGTPR